MKKLIDDKGRIFGKVNIVDFLTVLIILILIPAFFVGQRLLRQSFRAIVRNPRARDVRTHYQIERKCPNCGKALFAIGIEKGLPVSEIFPLKVRCPYCKNEVRLKHLPIDETISKTDEFLSQERITINKKAKE